MNKQVVYTCITGGYDNLREPKFVSSSIDYICFTDNAALTSKFWKIKQIPSELNNLSDVKKQRLIKILPHKYLSEYDTSLWIDSNITIVGDVKDFFNKYDLSQKFLYTNKHPGRDCLYREQLAVIRLKKDTYENTNPQIERYREEGFPEHYGLAETNIMLRSHNNPKCIKLMNAWGEEILRGSHRDQLSFNYCVWKCDVKESIEYLSEKYYNLHLADNSFFALENHIKMGSFRPFVDTREEENRRIAEELRKKQLEEEEERKRIEAEEEQKRLKEEEIAKILEKDKEEERKNRDLPIVPVVIFTHNRTNVAIETIRYLVKNIVYPKLRWIISDDRSENGHVEKLISFFGSLGIVPTVCRTNSTRWGLGASMNNGLKEAFRISDFVLRCEDDWILEKKLDLVQHIRTMMANKEVVAIRLAMVGAGVKVDDRRSIPGYKILYGDHGTNSWIFNNQVCLVNKKIHDKIGWYTENTTADKEESEFKDRFNKKSNWGKKDFMVLSPAKMRWGTLDDPSLWFIHVGRSTLGHTIYREPKRFSWIYERKEEKKPVKKELQKGLDAESIKKLVAAKLPEVNVEQKIENKVEPIKNTIAQRLFTEKKKEIVIKKEAQKIVETPKIVEEPKKVEEEQKKIEKKKEPKKEVEQKKEETKQIEKTDYDFIVSMTTYKPRLFEKNTIKILSALLDQKTSKKFKIVITLYKDDVQYVSKELQKFVKDHNIEILIADKNLRPHLKYFYAMKKYRDKPIITVDDDCLYYDDLFESLYRSYEQNRDVVSARRVHLMKYFKNGKCIPYNYWDHEYTKLKSPSFHLLATGVGGVIYPPDILKISDSDLAMINQSITADDIFLKWKENLLKVKVLYCKGEKENSYKPQIGYNQKYALCFENWTRNDKTIKALNLRKQSNE